MPPRTVILSFGAVGDVECRVLDSSDGMERANVHLQEVLLWSTYIHRFHELYFPRPESREEILDMASVMSMPILMAHGLDLDRAEKASRDLADDVLDRLLPANIGDAKPPGATTFERLAQAMEYRRQALRKLLAAVVQDASQIQLDAMVDACRNWPVALQIVDALMTGEAPDDNPDGNRGHGADGSTDAQTGGNESEADPAGGNRSGLPGDPGPGSHAGDVDRNEPTAERRGNFAPADSAGTLDNGGDAGPIGRPADERGTQAAADPVRQGDAAQPGGTGQLEDAGQADEVAPPPTTAP